ncbi:hypothetical protein PRIPAC_87193, partial [Pristionchus pacificus]|uniref:Uncharacterized protein n=1 Tax=Pristionchus pacificus TaxID=54126 RepID=A0A2A6CW64_PRIPA
MEIDKEDILRFTMVEPVPTSTQMFQVDDGWNDILLAFAIFYLHFVREMGGHEISIDLPEVIYGMRSFGNAVYFHIQRKVIVRFPIAAQSSKLNVHKAKFEPPEEESGTMNVRARQLNDDFRQMR